MKCGQWICFGLLIAAVVHGYAATPWHHPLSYSQGGYHRVRVHVDVTNSGDRDFVGESVQIAIGKLGFAGRSAAALRVVDAKGRELLFGVVGANGATRHDTPLAADDALFFRVDCPAGATERFWVYADNSEAMVVPEFLQSGFVNGDFEFGDAAPHGMKEMCDLAHKADPHVPIYSSTWRHVPEWNDYLDIWGVGQYGCFPADTIPRVRRQVAEQIIALGTL